MIPTMKLRS